MTARAFLILLLSCAAASASAAEIILWPEGVPEPRVPAEPAERVETAGNPLRFERAEDAGSVPQGSLALFAALLEAKVP